ncbi:NAD(+)/NADH kinase, partial [Neisseria sp.]|uniref:NAD(+)/NADH kinase n=2 Tax=Neisseria sp. TaxID=192066 RepID=UPI0035A0452D
MNSQFRNIGIVTRPQTPEIGKTLHALVQFLHGAGINIYLDADSVNEGTAAAEDIPLCQIITKATLGLKCDLVIVLGGDGTFLSVARELAPHKVPVIGVNQGHLGFLTQVSHDNMVEGLGAMLGGSYLSEERILLEVAMERRSERPLALNDVVLSRGGAGQMIEFEVFINGEFVYTQRSDGLIVSTPTGSTAYALAAGGPILQASLCAFTLVPICPQSMTNRPIAIADTCEIEILVT